MLNSDFGAPMKKKETADSQRPLYIWNSELGKWMLNIDDTLQDCATKSPALANVHHAPYGRRKPPRQLGWIEWIYLVLTL